MPWRNGGIRYSLIRDRVSTQDRWDFLKVHDHRLPSFSAPGRYLVTSQLTAIGGRDYVYCSNQARKVAIVATEKWHTRISAWITRCDDSLGAAVPLEVSLTRVFPKRGKCVGHAGFCVNAALSWRCIPIDLWSRAYRQHMPPWGQHCIVTLIKPKSAKWTPSTNKMRY